MAHFGKIDTFSISAGADLSTLQWYAVKLDGTRATNGKEAAGLIVNKPKAGEHCTVGISGRMKFRAGGTIVAGNKLTVDSNSTLIKASSGSWLIGQALAGCSSGSVGTAACDFVVPNYAVDSAAAS